MILIIASSSHSSHGRPSPGLDVNQTKKIRRKAIKAVFTDSPNTTTGGLSSASTAGTGTSTSGPFISRIIPLRRGRDFDRDRKGYYDYFLKRDKVDARRRRESKEVQRQQQHHQQQKKSTRLRYDDFVQPGHHRRHYLYRQRLWHYIRQQQLHNHAHQNRDSRGGFNPRDSHGSHHGYINPWWNQQWNHNLLPWMLQIHLEDAVKKSFIVGILVVCGGYAFYNVKSKQRERWNKIWDDVWKIREKLLETGEDPPWAKRKEKFAGSISVNPSEMDMTNHTLDPMAMIELREKAFRRNGGTYGVENRQMGPVSQGLHGSEKDIKMLTPEAVEKRLGQNQQSFKIISQETERGRNNPTHHRYPWKRSRNIVQGYTLNQVASNNPIEDDMSQHFIRNYDLYDGHEEEPERYFFGIYDGHSGWCCSQKVARELAPSISKELNLVRNLRDPQAVIEAIERGFVKLDQRIVQDSVKRVLEHPSRPLACSSLLPAISGACALMAYVDSRENDLYVACVGDSRAVMGVRVSTDDDKGHVWRAVPLSFDQTGRNPLEVKRLQEEHPGEETTIIRRGRVLGGLEPRPNYKTPPYVTAKPVVRHHKIRPEDRFMIMATDGLWDKLSSDEAVQLVGQLLDGKTGQDEMIVDREAILAYRQQLKVNQQIDKITDLAKHSKFQTTSALDPQQEMLLLSDLSSKGSASQPRKCTYRDHANASTHLIRNAIGGADDDKLAATLVIPSPQSRRHRDDITVTVVFFGRHDTNLALSDAQDATRGLTPIH
ncbi:hypothetical protein FBU30_010873 [Linnemannia zychae]|nr:hypothetical protein FBU30_010873 [Linnemannia zychae]